MSQAYDVLIKKMYSCAEEIKEREENNTIIPQPSDVTTVNDLLKCCEDWPKSLPKQSNVSALGNPTPDLSDADKRVQQMFTELFNIFDTLSTIVKVQNGELKFDDETVKKRALENIQESLNQAIIDFFKKDGNFDTLESLHSKTINKPKLGM